MSWFIKRYWVLILSVAFAVGIVVLGMNIDTVVKFVVSKLFSII